MGPNNIPYIVATITCNSAGGQPVSLSNLKATYQLVKKYDIPVVMDSARFAENAYFIQQRESDYKDWSIEDITRETYKYADMLAMSAKKDAMVPMGRLLCIKYDYYFYVYTECRTLCVVQEGFPTYGGLEGGAMERLTVGLYDGMNPEWLAYRIAQIQYLVDGLEATGVTCQQAGGHAAFVDAGKYCLISQPNSSRHRHWHVSFIKSLVFGLLRLAHSCWAGILKPGYSYLARQNCFA